MSLNPDIRDQAYQFFIEEAQELLQVLETGLLELRKDHSTPKVHELMRAAHSIKGGAASVELGAIELLAHRLEDFFKALYSDEVEFDAELEGLLLQGYDCLSHPLTEQIEAGAFDEEAALLTAEPVFSALEVRLEDALKNADNYIPSSNDLGVDIVSSIFEVDVAQSLDHLQIVATNPNSYDLVDELEGKLEIFTGFAELFNLPGFSEIVQTAQTALNRNPQRAIEIINATVADCTIAKDLVLDGDRTQGGLVSPALRSLAQVSDSEDSALTNFESNMAVDETILAQDNLWSDLPVEEPLREDIFATIPDENISEESSEAIAISETEESISSEEIALAQDNLWSDLPLEESLDEDIFATIPDENISEESSEAIAISDAEQSIPSEETVLAQDNLWSDLPVEEPLDEDIFATIPDENISEESSKAIAISETEESILSEETILAQDNLWSDLPVEEPFEEDIFATIPDENISEESSKAIAISDAEQSIPSEETVLAQDNLWSDLPVEEPLEEDIFATIPNENALSDEQTLEESIVEREAAINNDLSQIFDIASQESIVTETNTDSPELVDDINQMFEIMPAAEMKIEEQPAEDDHNDISQMFAVQLQPDVDNSASPTDKEIVTTAETPPQPENLTAAIESIEDIFDSLPTVANEPTSLDLPQEAIAEPQPQVTPTPAAKSTKKAKATPKLSVRVDLDRLERMNNLVGELTINRNSLALQNDQLQENVSELGQKFLRFREVTRKVREISDQMLLEKRSQSFSNSTKSADQPDSDLEEAAEFDSLEMDSYSSLHSSLQEVLEEIVQLEESVDDITIFAQQSDRTINSQRQMLDQMRDELMWVRMLPLDQILQRFPRTLRELSNKYHKPVELNLNGTGVLVDKAVLEKLSDPLLHLLRNGFDHGIEETEIRTQQGKPATGSIEIRAYYQGNQTVIEVKDDGKGLDLAKITQKGIEQGLITPQEAEYATQERLFNLIFEPGFSTASKVSELSGRGVGMNIVRSQIETLKGKIGVTSTPGEGSTFTLRLPLTLTIAKLLVCSLGATAFAIPSDSIEEIIIPTLEQVKFANEQKFLFLGHKLVPIYSLKEALPYNCPVLDTDANSKAFKTIAPPEDWLAPLLLLRRAKQLFALEIESLLSEQELVIKPYGKAIPAPPYSYGCTILGDGSLIPAFNGAALISTILGEDIKPVSSTSFTPASTEAKADQGMVSNIDVKEQITSVKTIMVVDDSTALRRTMALTLEKEGYRVVQKKDGKEALHGFKQNPDLDLIICDVEMPVMNGFEFLGMRRRDSALSQVPTFMLTSRSGAKHRNLAQQLGANGYFTKPYVEQEFVQEVKKILTNSNHSIQNNPHQAIAIKTKTILIIDDSSALRRPLTLSLEHRGYRVLQGRDGIEGLQQLRNNLQTNLVICDIEMPNLNGFEFLTTRRQEPQIAKIPVVMLTSHITEKHRALAISLGAVGFFTKPYAEAKLIQEIETYLC